MTPLSIKHEGECPYEEVSGAIQDGGRVRGHGSTDMPACADVFLDTDTEVEARDRITDLVHFMCSFNQ